MLYVAAIKFSKFSRKWSDGMGNNSGKIKYDKKNVLGRGISTVYGGTFEDKPVAVKRIERSNWQDREIEVQYKRIDHENVVKMLTVEEDVNQDYRYIVVSSGFIIF